MSVAPHVDWQQILGDLVYLGMTGTPLAARLGMSMALLRRIGNGERPKGAHAARIVALWCELTGKPVDFVPMTGPASALAPAAATVAQAATPGLASDDEHEPSFLALQAAFMVWGTEPH